MAGIKDWAGGKRANDNTDHRRRGDLVDEHPDAHAEKVQIMALERQAFEFLQEAEEFLRREKPEFAKRSAVKAAAAFRKAGALSLKFADRKAAENDERMAAAILAKVGG